MTTTPILGTPPPELLEALEHQNTRLTEVASLLRGLSQNNVLWSGTVELVGGQHFLPFTVPAAAVAVANPIDSGAVLTIAAGTPQASAPTQGAGVLRLDPGHAAVLPITGSSITLYGPAGELITLAVFSAPQPPSFAGGPTATPGA